LYGASIKPPAKAERLGGSGLRLALADNRIVLASLPVNTSENVSPRAAAFQARLVIDGPSGTKHWENRPDAKGQGRS